MKGKQRQTEKKETEINGKEGKAALKRKRKKRNERRQTLKMYVDGSFPKGMGKDGKERKGKQRKRKRKGEERNEMKMNSCLLYSSSGSTGCDQHAAVEANVVRHSFPPHHRSRKKEVWSSGVEHSLRVQLC